MTESRNGVFELEGVIKKLYPNTFFKVQLDMGGEVLAHLCGKMRKRYIRLTVGDRVKVEISEKDPARGRITYRLSGTNYIKRNKFYRKK